MKIKSLTTPIGCFDSIYVDSVLTRLVFLEKKDSIHPADKTLQSFIDEFFSIISLVRCIKPCKDSGLVIEFSVRGFLLSAYTAYELIYIKCLTIFFLSTPHTVLQINKFFKNITSFLTGALAATKIRVSSFFKIF